MLRRSSILLLLALLSPAACTDGDDGLVAPDAAPPEPEPAGRFGVATVSTPDGIRRFGYEEINGRAIAEGDMDLGPVDRFRSPHYGGAAIAHLAQRWPDGVINFRLSSTLSAGAQTSIRTELATLATLTPLRFNEVGYDAFVNVVEYMYVPWPTGSGSADVGMVGGVQFVLLFSQTPAPSTIIHETLHAAGFFHEVGRPDRDTFVDIDASCINPVLAYNFDEKEALGLGLYDFDSIMHYRTGSFCWDPVPAHCALPFDSDGDGVLDNTVCRTITRKNGLPIFPAGGPFAGATAEDINSVWRMYARSLDSGESADHFGDAIAIGDFNGDGYDDVAVGIPDEDIGSDSDAGAVHVYRGTSSRLVPWLRIDQDDTGDSATEDGDHFGAALFAADVNNDRIDDLLIGVPGENVGSVADAGIAHLFRGAATGLTWSRTYSQGDLGIATSDPGDRFGASLAAFTVEPGTALGSRIFEQVVAIGAPGERNGLIRSGAVFLVTERMNPTSGLQRRIVNKLFDLAGVVGDGFGEALAVGQLDLDGEDLVIGAPRQLARGVVHVHAGRVPADTPTAAITRLTQRIEAPTADAAFGAAVAIGNVRGASGGLAEVVVGAPGTATSAGDVHVYESTTAVLGGGSLVRRQRIHAGAAEPGDRYGSSLAVGNFDPLTALADIAIGVPGEDGGAGGVSLFRGGASIATEISFVRNTVFGGLQANEDEDSFGAALAVGNVDGIGEGGLSTDDLATAGRRTPDLVIGIPGEGLDTVLLELPLGAGAIGVLRGASNGPRASRIYTQASSTRD